MLSKIDYFYEYNQFTSVEVTNKARGSYFHRPESFNTYRFIYIPIVQFKRHKRLTKNLKE